MIEIALTDLSIDKNLRTPDNARWTLDIDGDRAILRDPAGNMRNGFTARDAAEQFVLPDFEGTVSNVQIPTDAGILPCDLDEQGFKQIKAFVKLGKRTASPEAARAMLRNALLSTLVGLGLAGFGTTITVLTMTSKAGSKGGTVYFGLVLLGGIALVKGLHGFYEYTRIGKGDRSMFQSQSVLRTPPSRATPVITTRTPTPKAHAVRPTSPCPQQTAADLRPSHHPPSIHEAQPASLPALSTRNRHKRLIVLLCILGFVIATVAGLATIFTLKNTPNRSGRSAQRQSSQHRPPQTPAHDPQETQAIAQQPDSNPDPDSSDDPAKEPQTKADTDDSNTDGPKEDLAEFLNQPQPGVAVDAADLVITGNIAIADPPASMRVGQFRHANQIRLIIERGSVETQSPLQCDIIESGQHVGPGARRPPEPAGIWVRSYFLHVDAPGNQRRKLEGSITFPDPIIGVIVTNDLLDATDKTFGLPGVRYASGGQWRQWWDGGGGEIIMIARDRRTITVSSTTGQYIDEMRVITEAR